LPPTVPMLGVSSLSVGEWEGTTSQGRPIAAPDLICMSGRCPRAAASYRAFGFSDGPVAAGPYTQVNGVFLPRNQARGQAIFPDYPDCGSSTVEWTATRR
jgi:hypothetical protein